MLSDEQLIEQIRRGDTTAFQALVEKYQKKMYAVAYGLVGNREDALDSVQEAFVKAYRSLERFKGESSFYTWLYRITVNTALNHAKKRSRVTRHEVEEVFEDPATVTQPDAGKRLEAEDTAKRLKVLLDQLNPDQRACIISREIEGMDYQEIARSLGININTVRSRLKRARETLMELGQKEVASHGM